MTETSPPDPPASPPRKRRSDLRRLARASAELFSVAAVLSFLLAVWTNQLVFDRWGLNFLQVATVADVVMSGLNLLFWGFPLTLAFAAAYAVAKLRWIRWLRWALAAPAGLLFVLGFPMITLTSTGFVAVLLGGVILTALLLPSALHARRHPSHRGLARQVTAGLMAAITTVALVQSTVLSYAENGYGARPLELISPALPDCAGRLLWTGERAAVVGCDKPENDRPPRRIILVQDPQGWVYRRLPKAPEPKARRRHEGPAGSGRGR